MPTLAQIAQTAPAHIHGDPAQPIHTLASLTHAGPHSLSFYAHPKHQPHLKTTTAGAVMLRAEHAPLFPGPKLIVRDPHLAWARTTALFAPPPPPPGIHPTAIISPTATIHPTASIAPNTTIDAHTNIAAGAIIGSHTSIGAHCRIGANTRLAPAVHLHPRTCIGARCRVSSGVIIGASGFGYTWDTADDQPQPHPPAHWLRIEQLGGVTIGDDVDIGANTTIDRGTLDDTVIATGVKLDNHIHIAHNVRIGAHTIMAGCVAIAGSTTIGQRCRLGGRASILGHLTIPDDTTINANSFVSTSITQPGTYSSMIPVQPAAQWRKTAAHIHRIDHLARALKSLKALKGTPS